VEADERGYFLRCPFCSSRVAMERVPAAKGEAFRLVR
jgi:DNA-directed RNA polymerase subunit RPC12/RpoP